MCKTPPVSANIFSKEGAGHHQEHEVNLIFHTSCYPEINDAARETHPNVVNYQSLPIGASSRQIKLRTTFKRKFGTALPTLEFLSTACLQ